MKIRTVVLTVLGLAVVGAAGYFIATRVLQVGNNSIAGTDGAQAGNPTAKVTTLTLVNSVESTGSVEAIPFESLSWQTTGAIANIYVKVGDAVKKGDVLMTIDPATAPQSVNQARIDLINAQEALDALLNPSALEIAYARQAVTTAEQALKDAQQDLKYVQNPVGQSLYNTIDDTKVALDTALANQQLERVSADASAVKSTEDDMNLAYSRLQRTQTAMDDCIKISCGERVRVENELNSATKAYQTAWDAHQAAKLKYDTNIANQTDDVRTAQQNYDQAIANLNAAMAGPSTLELQTAQDAVAVAEADLAEKQAALDELLNGADPNDIAAAEANMLAAQATIDTLTLKAPFEGEVLQVNFRPGESATQTETAITLANRAQLYVDVQVDESDISKVNPGDLATLTFDSLPDLSLTGRVAEVVPIGETVQGLVKYTARVDFDQTARQVLLGMTTNVSIVTDTIEDALAVPIDAVQQNDEEEYVIRLRPDGAAERVVIVSGTVEDNDLVVVTGDLQPGDVVQLGTVQTATTNNPGGVPGGGFGGGGFGGGGGPGGGGGNAGGGG